METLETRIKLILHKYPGLRARIIAAYLGVDRATINRSLYSQKDSLFYQDDNWGWHNGGSGSNHQQSSQPSNRLIASPINTIHNIFNQMYEEEESIFYLEKYKIEDTEAMNLFYIDAQIVSFYFDLVLEEENYYLLDELEFEDFIGEYKSILSPFLRYGFFEDDSNGFCTRLGNVPYFLYKACQFDKKYMTSFAYLLVECFQLLGQGIKQSGLITAKNILSFQDHVEVLAHYVDDIMNEGSVLCCICGSRIPIDDAVTSDESYFCTNCFDLDDEDDECEEEDLDDEEDTEIEVESNQTIDYSSTLGKHEIVEDCRTCVSRKSCLNAKYNRICEKYLYSNK